MTTTALQLIKPKTHTETKAATAVKTASKPGKTETATFAAGCFWGVEESYRQLPGVLQTMVGYCGGDTENPTYQEVCSDEFGHAEAVQVVFDPKQIDYETLVEMFWTLHNPTLPNQQGLNYGSQYRSIIFYHSSEQKRKAEASKKKAQAMFQMPIVTAIEKAKPFYPAEEYHQKFFLKRNVKYKGVC